MQKRTSVEIQAVTVDDAVRLALEQLELTRDDVDIEILVDEDPAEENEALVRVTAKGQATQPEATGPRRADRRRRRGQGGRASANRLGGRTSPGDRPSRRGTPPLEVGQPDRVPAEDEQTAKDILVELLDRMGVEADVMAVDNPSAVALGPDDPPTIFLDVVGHDLGMLIGRRGEHLTQLQYLVNTIVNRQLDEWSRVIVDVEGYRSRREETLVGLAERVARQVARSGRAVVLEPMPPNERRIIHLTLRSHPAVSTLSSGEGEQRRITIEPAR